MKFFSKLTKRGNGTLNWLSRTLNLDIPYFVKGGFWFGMIYLTHTIMRLLQVIILARFFDKQFYGEYQFVISALFLMGVFALPGMGSAITQSVARGYDYSVVSGIKTKLKWSLLGSLVLFGIAGYLKFVNPQPFWHIFLFIALLFPAFSGLSGLSSYFIGKEDFRKGAICDMAIEIVGVLAVIGAAMTGSLLVIILTYMISVIAVQLFIFYRITRKIKTKPIDLEVSAYGRHLTFMNIINSISPYLDRFIVAFIVGLEGLAVFSIAIAIVPYLSYGSWLFSLVFLPKFSRQNPEHVKKVKKLFWIFCLGVILLTAGIVAIMPWLIPFLFSQKYAESILYAQIACLCLIFALPSSILGIYFQGAKRTRTLYAYNLTSGIMNIILLTIFVPLFGIIGAVLSKVALGFYNFIFLVIAFYKK